MRYWYAYTGSDLIIGRGRAIRHVVTDSPAWQKILNSARETAAPAGVAQETFAATLAAVIAARELSDEAKKTTAFSSQQQVFQLFDDVHIGQSALNIINGRVASAYAEENLPARVAEGFTSGELWQLPRDADRLRDKATLAELPGVVATLLMREQAESKAFARYLRRGAEPVLSEATRKTLAATRPILRTFEREARRIAERRKP
jgi:hypothetical protein